MGQGADRGHPLAPKGMGNFGGVFDALASNQRDLQRNLHQAAQRLAPLAHVASALSKALPQSVPAVLTAASAGAAAALQPTQQPSGWDVFTHSVQLQGGGRAAKKKPPAAAAAAAATAAAAGAAAADPDVVCIEYTKGRRRVYKREQPSGAATGDTSKPSSSSSSSGSKGSSSSKAAAVAGGFVICDEQVRHRQRLGDMCARYLLPDGFPHSVAPQYADYMFWRGIQYFFGGAMSVFTTRSLLSSLGVANKRSSEAAAAINWVVKDGAGRMGRFLFARWGRELDCELKQFRLAGDALMEMGAALELSTVLMPRWFLPLACTANLAKNLAAVAASSTRAPIYRTFARQNNLADVTAKGESVANLADVVGTAFGIALAKGNLPVLPTFCALSVGYLVASRREVDSVVLPYLNRARLSYAARKFYATGKVPGTAEANANEPLMPWADPHNGRVVLGATVEEACVGPQQLKEALASFAGRQYALTYRSDTRKCYALIKENASPEAVLQAAVDAHCLLWMLDHHQQQQQPAAAAVQVELPGSSDALVGSQVVGKLHRAASSLAAGGSSGGPSPAAAAMPAAVPAAASPALVGQRALEFVASNGGKELRDQFEREAAAGGWKLQMTMLNPRETRLAVVR